MARIAERHEIVRFLCVLLVLPCQHCAGQRGDIEGLVVLRTSVDDLVPAHPASLTSTIYRMCYTSASLISMLCAILFPLSLCAIDVYRLALS